MKKEIRNKIFLTILMILFYISIVKILTITEGSWQGMLASEALKDSSDVYVRTKMGLEVVNSVKYLALVIGGLGLFFLWLSPIEKFYKKCFKKKRR